MSSGIQFFDLPMAQIPFFNQGIFIEITHIFSDDVK